MKENTKITNVMMIFIIMQPFLDFYLLYSDKVIKLFKFSPSTIIRICFIIFFLIYFFIHKEYRNIKKWTISYLIIILLYIVLHIVNSLKFTNDILGNFNFSYVTELFYFIRLLIPIFMIWIMYKLKMNSKDFQKTIIITSLIFSLEIVITNILKCSLTSYGGNNIISGNIFDWFRINDFQFEQLASKGFFYMANQISGVLTVLLPINIYFILKNNKWINYASAFLVSLAMIMLGTRIGTYGCILVWLVVFVMYVLFAIIYNNKIEITIKKIAKYFCVIVLLTLIALKSPLISKRISFSDYEKKENQSIPQSIKSKINNLKSQKETENFVKKYSEKYSIPIIYIEYIYPYEYDPDFWINTMKLPYSVRGGNRNIENLITKQVYNRNNNELDKFFGMGYSRFRNAELYIEQDFVVHYYTIGLVGILLLFGPYVTVVVYAIIYMLKNKKLNLKISILCMSVLLCLAISYLSGHILDELIVTIILGFISGFILICVDGLKEKPVNSNKNNYILKKYNKKHPYLSIIVPVYNSEKYIEKCINSLINQSIKNIEIIIINDGSTDGSKNILSKYEKKYDNVILKNVKNCGVSSARNMGIDISKGEYLAFVDSDDYVEYDMYEKMYSKAKSNDLDLVACDVNVLYPKKTKKISSGFPEQSISNIMDKKRLLIDSYAVIWNKIYKRKLLEKIRFKNGSNFCEDVKFLYEIIPQLERFGNVNEYLYNYVQRVNSLTYVYDSKLYQLIDNFNDLYHLYKTKTIYKKYNEEFEYSYVRYLYATFIKRLSKTKDKVAFKNGVDNVIANVNNKFPNYNKNKYLKKFKLKNLYLLHFSKKLSNIVFVFEKNKLN